MSYTFTCVIQHQTGKIKLFEGWGWYLRYKTLKHFLNPAEKWCPQEVDSVLKKLGKKNCPLCSQEGRDVLHGGEARSNAREEQIKNLCKTCSPPKCQDIMDKVSKNYEKAIGKVVEAGTTIPRHTHHQSASSSKAMFFLDDNGSLALAGEEKSSQFCILTCFRTLSGSGNPDFGKAIEHVQIKERYGVISNVIHCTPETWGTQSLTPSGFEQKIGEKMAEFLRNLKKEIERGKNAGN